jgi:hypothetical protein
VPQVRHRSVYTPASLRFSRLEINNGSIILSHNIAFPPQCNGITRGFYL